MSDNNQSKTQAIRLELTLALNNTVQKLETLSEAVEKVVKNTENLKVTEKLVEQHESHHQIHFKAIERIRGDVNKAKGWAAALGFAGGFITSWFKH